MGVCKSLLVWVRAILHPWISYTTTTAAAAAVVREPVNICINYINYIYYIYCINYTYYV
jgi:hypothetical protein